MTRNVEMWPPDGTQGSVTIVWLTTEADDQSFLHCAVVLTGVMSEM